MSAYTDYLDGEGSGFGGSSTPFSKDFNQLGEVGAVNSRNAQEAMMMGAQGLTDTWNRKAQVAIAKAQARRQGGGGGGLLGGLISIGSSFLGPIGGAIGKQVAGKLF